MSEIIGFIPEPSPTTTFQGESVDSKTGLIGFRAHTPEEVDAFHNEELLKKSDKQADLLAEQVKAKKTGDYWQGVSDRIDGVQSLVEPLTRPASGVLGGALDAANNAAFSAQGRDDLAGNLFETAFKTPIVDLPKMDKTKDDLAEEDAFFAGDEEAQKELERSTAGKVGSGLYNATVELLKGFTSPDVLSLLPAAANKAVLAAWLGQTVVHFPDRVVAAKDHFAKGDTQSGVQEVGIGLGEVLMLELGRRYMNKGGVADNPRIRDSVDTGVAGSGIPKPEQISGPLTPSFDLRSGETWKQMNARVEMFQEGRKQITDYIDAEVIPDPAPPAALPSTPVRGQIADGPGPILVGSSLDAKLAKLSKDKTTAIKRAGEMIRLARLQDNPVLIEGAQIIEDGLRGASKEVTGGKLEKGTPYPAAVSQAAPVTPSLTGEWPPQRPPSRPDEGVVDPNAPQPDLKGEWPPSKDPLSKALEDALRRVLNVPAPRPSTKPADIRRQLEYRSRSMEGPAEAPVEASQSPAIQSPSEPIKVDPGASSSVPAPQKVVKPWEIRQQLQERSRSVVEPIEKNTPQGGELIPSMPGVRNFVEVPDNHPVVQFWRTPDAEKYAGIKAREAFPNDPATAADVANEAYAHLYLKASEFPAGRVKAQPWALTTISNYIKDRVIKVQREGKLKADNSEESVTTAVDSARDPLPLPDQAVVLKELEAAIGKVEETLNDADREIYSVMTGFSKLDFKGVAEKQGVSPATISRRKWEIRGKIINALRKDKVDVGDYMEVMEAMNAAEEAPTGQDTGQDTGQVTGQVTGQDTGQVGGKGIGGSTRKGGKFKGGKRSGEAGFSTIIPALSRIMHGWMRSGVSAARAVGHAVKMFGKGIAKWASLVTNRASYKTSSTLQGFSRPSKPATPWTQISRTKMRSADIRHPGFFRRPGNWSSVDIFRKAGMTDVVEQALQHEDRRAEWIGRWTTPLAEIENRYSAKEYKQGAKDFSEYWKLKESRDGGKTQAQADADALAYSIRMSQAGMDMVEWVEKVAEETNKISRDLDVQVKAGNTWRAGNFNDANYPRRPAQWFKDVTRDPRKNSESKALMRQLQRDMVTNGNAKTLDAAEHMLTKDQWWDDRSGGYLANSEKARGMKLPDRVYEYSVDDYISYVDQVADRLSQIEAFGQDLMGTRDTLFEVAASRTTDQRLSNALGEMREHYLGKHEGGNFMELARKANVITTGAYLGFSPLTAVRNVWGAQANAMYKYGVTPVIVASAKVAQHNLVAAAKSMVNVVGGNAKSVRSIDALVAQEIGAVQRDMRYAMVNSHVTNKPIINVKGLRGLTEENSMRAAMAINTLAERMGREITNAAAETWMRHTASFIQWDPNHPISRSRTADLRRLNFTTPEIAQLVAGDPVLMDRFRRAAVQKTNFGYSASESSTLFDKGWMKVFGQFQRYGAQAARFVDNDIVKPMFQKEGGKWTPNFLPFIKLMILAPVLGELYQEMREGVFNKPRKTASIEEIGNTLTDDVKQGLTLMAQRYSTDVIYGSGLGIISDWFGMLKEFGERGRFKNPLEPPAFTLVEQFGQLLQHRRQRGLTFEGLGSDLSDFFKRFPAISQATGVSDRIIRWNDSKAGKLVEANFVKQEARALTERFARERGGEINTKFNSSMRNVDENTAELDSLKDAMLSGDSKEARKIAISFIESAKDTAKARRTVQSVVKMGHPLYNQTAGINTLADVEDFLKWLGKRAPSKVADFRKVALRYESSSP